MNSQISVKFNYLFFLVSKMDPLIFLLKLAWDCRFRLPLLITIGFMVLDVRMQVDINVHTGPRRLQRDELNRPEMGPQAGELFDTDGEWFSDGTTETGYLFCFKFTTDC